MTALAFTAVIALLTVMMAFVNGMTQADEADRPAGQRAGAGRRRHRRSHQQPDASATWRKSRTCPRWSARTAGRMASRETYLVANQPIPIRPTAGRSAASCNSAASKTRS